MSNNPRSLGIKLSACPDVFSAVALIPDILAEQIDRDAVIAARDRTGTAGIFPFRLGGQAIAGAPQDIGGDRHASGHMPRPLGSVAPLVLRQPLLLAQPVAVGGGIIPGDPITGPVRVGTEA